tara:strand:+ start:3445 stop:3759 length:315 start_codon:yes stop_codon:yes gene_type:complete
MVIPIKGSRRGGKRYAPRLVRQIIEHLGEDGEATSQEIYHHLIGRTKMSPTRNQLSNILKKSGFFIPIDVVNSRNVIGNRSRCNLWAVDVSAAESEGLITRSED